MTQIRTRTEKTADQLETRRSLVLAKIKIDFENLPASYVASEDMKYVVGRRRDRETVFQEFTEKMLKDFSASVVDVGGGRVAIVKR